MRPKSFLFIIIILSCVYGCGWDQHISDNLVSHQKIEFCLSPNAPAQTSITRIDLTITVPGVESPIFSQIGEINVEKHTARGVIELPVGSGISFHAKAFDGDCPVLDGLLENMEITPDQQTPITLQLSPIQIVIGIRSEQESLRVGDIYSVEVYVEDAPRLFAFNCELEFDPQALLPLEGTPGNFFGEADDYLFIEDSQFPQRQEDRLALGITLKAYEDSDDNIPDVDGVCGSGVVFRVSFEATGSGDATVTLLEDTLILTTPAFEEIQDSSRVRVEAKAFVNIE